ncbi:major facilitator superfamily domain-containing protein 9-like [Babylonia areolata]|uniref:major facilitator superfamily domain-containing protein 9-like n=1 Tax=Babylonia areolata TaxID=304850 RepID=UPI003FD45050
MRATVRVYPRHVAVIMTKAKTNGTEKMNTAWQRVVNPVSLLYFSGFLDLFGVSMIIPLMLPYARDLGASPALAGAFDSVYGALQLFSSPALGQWSDRKGRHLSLSVCLVVAGASYMAMSLASSMLLLLLARIPLGIFKHSQSLSRTYLADLVPEGQRSSVLGRFNAASSIGFILGPMVGGHVAELPGGFQTAAFMGGAVFCLNAVLVWFLLPGKEKGSNPDHPHPHHRPSSPTPEVGCQRNESSMSLNISQEIPILDTRTTTPTPQLPSLHGGAAVDWADLWDLFLLKFLAGFSVLLFRSNFTQVLRQKFDAGPRTRGYLMSYGGLVSTLCSCGVGRVTALYSSLSQLCLHMLLLQSATLASLTLAPSVGLVFALLTPLSFVTATQRVATTELTLRRGGNKCRGGLIGLSHSVMSVARMLSPFLAGLVQEVHVDGASLVAVVTTFCAAVLLYFWPQDPELRKRKVE